MLNTLYDFIKESFEDSKLSRNEASVFRQLLEDAALNARERGLLNHFIQEEARKRIRDSRDGEILEWFAAVNKVMTQAHSDKDYYFDALFFPSDQSLQRVLELIKSARKTLDICVFTITDNRIASAILDVHEKGVKVRIISDDDKAADLGSDVISLSREGIPVRFDDAPDHMHHKFAVIDGKRLLNGSFNWTRSASLKNQENMMITDQPKMVQMYSQEFEKLWKQFEL